MIPPPASPVREHGTTSDRPMLVDVPGDLRFGKRLAQAKVA